MNRQEAKKLKKGDKLIFIDYGGVLSAAKGNVFTFSHIYNDTHKTGWYWQCIELLEMGNKQHTFGLYSVEFFDLKIHKKYRIMNEKLVVNDEKEFVKKYGT